MSLSVKNIEDAVAGLPPEELEEFRAWYERFDADAWDRQIEQDAGNGKLDGLAEAAIAQHRAGNTRSL